MLIDTIKQFGLNDKEAAVYLALLELGETTVQRLSQKSKVKRTSIYDILSSLKEKGLAGSTLKNKRRFYVASDPRDMEFKLDERKAAIRSVLPELLSIANFMDKKPKIRFYEGEEGIKEIYLDTLNYPNRPLWAWVSDEIFGVLDDTFLAHYLSSRVKKKIWAYVIAPETQAMRRYKSDDNRFLRRTILEDPAVLKVQVEIDLYGPNKIGIMAFKEKIGLIIESQKIFMTLKSIFDIHWTKLGGE
ncbi:hypothetical protein KGP36_04145 [Patescibacteria group bacterium]|nr:hypothetical protein [Patescibacteria group bacterium]